MFNHMQQDHEAMRRKPYLRDIIVCLLLLGTISVEILLCFIISEKESTEESYFEYTQDDVQMLGDLMYAEISLYDKMGISFNGETDEDVKKVYMLTGSALLHRLESRLWGETMWECITAPGQYFHTTQEAIGNIDTPDEVYEWAKELLQNGPDGPEGLIYASCFEQGEDIYWKIDGKVYFGVMSQITQKVKGGKVN